MGGNAVAEQKVRYAESTGKGYTEIGAAQLCTRLRPVSGLIGWRLTQVVLARKLTNLLSASWHIDNVRNTSGENGDREGSDSELSTRWISIVCFSFNIKFQSRSCRRLH
jgi:hypothetical protein